MLGEMCGVMVSTSAFLAYLTKRQRKKVSERGGERKRERERERQTQTEREGRRGEGGERGRERGGGGR